jgi:Arc/MetJ-type ribon-helix-helix transcriptional regulator
MHKKTPLEIITVRVPPDVLAQLPAPSLEGRRAEFIREAIEEKLERERRREARKRKMQEANP